LLPKPQNPKLINLRFEVKNLIKKLKMMADSK